MSTIDKHESKAIGIGMALIARESQEERSAAYSEDNMSLVNKFSKVTLKTSDVYIRSMWLANDIIDSYYSRFNEKTLGDLARLSPKAPILIGHQKGTLPIGKTFKAQTTRREDGHWWLRTWFYWPKDMNHSEDLERGIETGLYDECSISWAYDKAWCSICSKDIRTCDHIPGNMYHTETGERLCWYETDDITDVLEASFVYKGGQVGTSIDDERKKLYAQRALILDKKIIDLGASGNATQSSRDDSNVEDNGGADNELLSAGDGATAQPAAPAPVNDKNADDSDGCEEAFVVEAIEGKEIDRVTKEGGPWKVCPNYKCRQVKVSKDRVLIIEGSDEKDISDRLVAICRELKGNDKEYRGFIFKKRGNSRLPMAVFDRWLNDNHMDDHSIHIKLFDNSSEFKDRSHVQSIKTVSMDAPSLESCLKVGSKDGFVIFNDKKMFIVDKARTKEEVREKFNCECIKCGHTMQSDKHCNELKCPECGGDMRRKERPGPGRSLDPCKKDELKINTAKSLYRVYDNGKEFYQFAVEGKGGLRWLRLPISTASSMIVREVESLDDKRSMLLCDMEAVIKDDTLSIKSDRLSGSYRIINTILNGQKIKIARYID
jgi:predicted RNA-binding Zn-ribbon protein involved in translation (DUF1610 family)